MWWVIISILVIGWLCLGAYMAKRFLQDCKGVTKIEDDSDYLVVGLVTIAGPIYIPLLVPFWGIGFLASRIMGFKKKKEKSK